MARLDEGTVKSIYATLLERFGEPIADAEGDGQGVPTSGEKKDMGNRGFGAKLDEGLTGRLTCGKCGGMMQINEMVCSACNQMADELDEKAPPGREKQVKALKKQKGVKNPWAVAWASYNKR